MTLFFTTLAATVIGTFVANLGILWLIGARANQVEQQRIKDMVKQQQELMAALQQEQERMQRYAAMES
jgi:hypothetical protein